MVGWSRRNAESARASRRAAERYDAWFKGLTPEEQAKETIRREQQDKKDVRSIKITLAFAFIFLFVIFPLVMTYRNKAIWKSWWDNGRVVSNDGKTICKEIEYCAPCAPIHHWQKGVFCEPVK